MEEMVEWLSSIGSIISSALLLIVLMVAFFLINYMIKSKKFVYKIIFLRKQNDIMVFYKTVKFPNITRDTIKYDKRTFNVTIDKCSYVSSNREFIYFIDYDSGSTYSFTEIKSIDPETLEMLISNNIVSQITKSLGVSKFDWKNFLFGAICGAFVTLIVCMVLFKNEEPPNYYPFDPSNTFNKLFSSYKLLG